MTSTVKPVLFMSTDAQLNMESGGNVHPLVTGLVV